MQTTIAEMPTRDDRPGLSGPDANRKPAPADLPRTPEEIDLERVVDDVEYRQAVKDLLRRWGFGPDDC